MTTLRIGALGAARITPAALVKPAGQVDGVAVVAVAARDGERAAKFAARHGIPRVVDSYAALIADPGIDAIYNPLPNGLHGVWTTRALEAGKHVLCEKPLGLSEADAWLTELSTGSARARIARFVLRMVNGSKDSSCELFSREDMGAMLGITTETASRTVAEFKRQGFLKEISSNHFYAEVKKLRRIAEG